MTKGRERKVVEIPKGIPINETNHFVKKHIKTQLGNIFTKKEIYIFGVLYIVFSLILSITIISAVDNYYRFAVNIVSFITPFYAITIGFSITSIVFILNNATNFKTENRNTLSQIVALIISYIVLGLISILYFLLEVILGSLFSYGHFIDGLISFLIFFIILTLICISFHFFFTIIKVLYYLSHMIIKDKAE
ncbi:hypothetical protein [Salinicoccus roseus]|uniref:hypothetical protein n=1 Tax=Salinicoccus roseus TaxID=45670 RepID=UPI00230042AA|nr:hypothetical protein [Salinicoccus roseus]